MVGQRTYGRGVSRFVQELMKITDRRAKLLSSDIELATAIDDKTIQLDRDGYHIYSEEGDFITPEHVRFVGGDRLLVSPMGSPRGPVAVLGRLKIRSDGDCTSTLVTPTSGITAAVDDAVWVTDDYVAVLLASGVVEVYNFTDGVWGSLADSQQFSVGDRYIAVSPDGAYIAVAGESTPFIRVYNFDTGTGMFGSVVANPGTIPAGTCRGVAWSPDGMFIAVGHVNTPWISVWPWTGAFGTKVANPTLPTGMSSGRVPSWTPNMDAIVITHSFSGVSPPNPDAVYSHSWVWSGGSFGALHSGRPTPLDDPYYGAEIHPDGNFVAFSGDNASDPIIVFEFNPSTGIGDRVPSPVIGPEKGSSIRVSWHPEGTSVASGFISSGGGREEEARFLLIGFNNGVFGASSCPGDLLFEGSDTAQFSPSGQHLLVSGGGSSEEVFVYDIDISGPVLYLALTPDSDGKIIASNSLYFPAVPSDWLIAPSTVSAALDELAARVIALEP